MPDPVTAAVGATAGGALLGGGGGGSGGPSFTPNPIAVDQLNALFPDGAPALAEPPPVVFDPSLIFQGIDFATLQSQKGFDIAKDQFDLAKQFQLPFFNQAKGFKALSSQTLGGQFDPRDPSNAFLFDPSDPEFQFLFERGVDAIDSAASAKGTLFSGGRAKDLTSFGQGLASTFADDALRRRQAVSQQNFNQLATLAGFEQPAANNLSNINTQLGTLGANIFSGLGTAGLSALAGGAGLQNQTALANAANALTAQGINLDTFLGLVNSGSFSGPQPDPFGQLLGIGLSTLPFIL